MAKLNSLIKLEGTLDGLTFYKSKDGYLVRTKGGISKNRIQNDPAFARTRENGNEFGHVAKSGKIIRQALTPLLTDVKDSRLSSRMTKVLSAVKNTDTTSSRGNRQVSIGLAATDGKNFFKDFDFNQNAKLDGILLTDYTLDTTTGEVTINNVNPMQHINAPSGATHISITAAVLHLNLNTNEKELALSSNTIIPINATSVNINATPDSVPSGTGQQFFFLKLAFYQEINGFQYALNNGAYNVLKILDIL